MQQFAAVATAHFLALIIPGVDFFLIVRTATSSGRRAAAFVCAGIAAANALVIAVAFGGLAVVTDPRLLDGIRIIGGVFLVYIGVCFTRNEPGPLVAGVATTSGRWWRNVGLGATSGLLNPKNLVFYAGLAAAVSGATVPALIGYGTWMVLVVLAWDVLIATLLGSGHANQIAGSWIQWLSVASGVFLIGFGGLMLIGAVRSILG